MSNKEIEKIQIENLQNDKNNLQNIVDSCLHFYADVYFKLKYNKINRDSISTIRAKMTYLSLLYKVYVRQNEDNDTIFYRLDGNFHAALILCDRGKKLGDDLDSNIKNGISFYEQYAKKVILAMKNKTLPPTSEEVQKERPNLYLIDTLKWINSKYFIDKDSFGK
jgi:hypothetical protein